MNIVDQHGYDIRLEWGMHGVEVLAPVSDVIIIVDVLSFSTCVDIATARGAAVYPYYHRDDSAIAYAQRVNALLAGPRSDVRHAYSLSPHSLLTLSQGTSLVLPSPNGSALSLSTGRTRTICGCLRNASAIATYAVQMGKSISVIPAGERWEDGSIRFAIEDLIGAGAIISQLSGRMSPESQAALAVFASCTDIQDGIMSTASGKELIAAGFAEDVTIACEYNISDNVPLLTDGAYRQANQYTG